jgi:hypothetical protein
LLTTLVYIAIDFNIILLRLSPDQFSNWSDDTLYQSTPATIPSAIVGTEVDGDVLTENTIALEHF